MARTHKILTSPLTAGTTLDEERKLEQEMLDGGIRRFWKHHHDAAKRGHGASFGAASTLLKHWYEPTMVGIRACQQSIRDGSGGFGVSTWGPVMMMVPASKLAAISLYVCISRLSSSHNGMAVSVLAYDIGAAVMHQVAFDRIRRLDKEKPTEKRIARSIRDACKNYSRKRWNHLLKHKFDEWQVDRKLCITIGARLLNIMGVWCYVEDENGKRKPAFRQFDGPTTRKYTTPPKSVRLCDEAVAIVEDANRRLSMCRPRYMAMRIEPQPWQQIEMADEDGTVSQQTVQGGYVYIRTPLISHVRREHKKLLEKANLRDVYECHNAMGMTPMQPDPFIHTLQREVWKQGGGTLGLPPANDPPKPLPLDNPTSEQLYRHKKDLEAWHDRCIGLKGERESYAQALACADWYARLPEVYFPHQMDFRGREYPLPAQLNFQGDDPRRSLLRLAKAVPVSDRGRYWIMVHAANCYGHDKLPFEERVQWVMDNLSGVTKSVKHGLDEEFWQRAENPWQFLAACKAIVDPEAAAHLPVQQDATCSGLQHYAALCLDGDGAARVNMVPGDRVEDVYSSVLDAVKPKVAMDAHNGNAEAADVLPYLLRKVIKQNVMTTVYGVTTYGMTDQVEVQLLDRGMARERARPCAMYLARAVYASLGEVMHGAVTAMEYLRELCSTVVAVPRKDGNGSRPTGRVMSWDTPLGLPVVQSYRKMTETDLNTAVGSITVTDYHGDEPVRVRKQRDAFPPNFIHSLDATHNLCNARECHRAGYAYIPIHDCFGTHAEHVDAVGGIVRSQFIHLYRNDWLANLANQTEHRFPGVKVPEPPERGSFDLSQVGRSRYFYC